MTLTTRRLAVLILFVGLFAMAVRVSVGADTWWHLRAGQWMLANGRLLNTDVFSFTQAGAEWINHSWLSQLPLYLAWALLGYAGLNLLVALVVVATFTLVYRTCAGGEYLRAFVVILAAAASGVYWSARPQMASLVLAAAFALILLRFRRDGHNRLWLLPPLMLLWVNAHGGFAIGFILLLVTLVGEGLKLFALQLGLADALDDLRSNGGRLDAWLEARAARWGIRAGARAAGRRVGQLALTGLACAALVSLNPYGPRMLAYPFVTVSIGVLQDFIQEWQSPNFHLLPNQVFLWLLFATVAAIGFSRLRVDATDFLLLAVFATLGFVAGRNVAVFAVVAAPVLARHLDAMVADLQGRFPSLALAARAPTPPQVRLHWLVAALVIVAALAKVSQPLSRAVNEAALAEFQPVAAVAHLRAAGAPGNLFNSYNWGGFLIWELYPETPVFVDGRTDLYDDEFLRTYLATTLARPGWRDTLDRYELDTVLVESDSILAGALAEDAAWRAQYTAEIASILVRAAP